MTRPRAGWLTVRLEPAELEEVDRRAAAAGLDRSDYARLRLLDEVPGTRPPTTRERTIDVERVREMAASGMSDPTIAAALGVSKQGVRKVRAAEGIPALARGGRPKRAD